MPWRKYNLANRVVYYSKTLQSKAGRKHTREIIDPIKYGSPTLLIVVGNKQQKTKDCWLLTDDCKTNLTAAAERV